MRPEIILDKTGKGRREIDRRPRTLSILERRVLILTNGERTVEQLSQMASVRNFADVVEKLHAEGYVAQPGQPANAERGPPAAPVPAPATPSPAPGGGTLNVEAREFMVNMLLTFTNRVRVARLLDTIGAARTDEDLKSRIDEWHAAIAESPNGLSEVDKLRSKLLEMLVLGHGR